MTQDAEDWTDLADAWTAPTAEAEAPAASPGSIAAAVRRRALLATLNFYVELGVALLAGGVVVGLAVADRVGPVLALAAVAFTGFAAGMTIWARGLRGHGDTDTPVRALETAVRQAESGLRWAWSGLAITAASMVFVVVVLTEGGRLDLISHAAGAWMLLFLSACIVFYSAYAVRSRRRRARWRAALDELQAD